MNLAADLGSVFVVLGATGLAFAQIVNIRQWIVISSKEATGLAGCVYIRSCF